MATVRSWRQMVLDADPDFHLESIRPIVYEFSNGRKFRQPADPYGVEYITDDDATTIITDDDSVTPIASGA